MAAAMTTSQLTGEVAHIKETVKQHDEWIEGNGKPGAKTRVTLLENGQKDIKESLEKIYGRINGLIWGVVAAVVIEVVTRILNVGVK